MLPDTKSSKALYKKRQCSIRVCGFFLLFTKAEKTFNRLWSIKTVGKKDNFVNEHIEQKIIDDILFGLLYICSRLGPVTLNDPKSVVFKQMVPQTLFLQLKSYLVKFRE